MNIASRDHFMALCNALQGYIDNSQEALELGVESGKIEVKLTREVQAAEEMLETLELHLTKLAA